MMHKLIVSFIIFSLLMLGIASADIVADIGCKGDVWYEMHADSRNPLPNGYHYEILGGYMFFSDKFYNQVDFTPFVGNFSWIDDGDNYHGIMDTGKDSPPFWDNVKVDLNGNPNKIVWIANPIKRVPDACKGDNGIWDVAICPSVAIHITPKTVSSTGEIINTVFFYQIVKDDFTKILPKSGYYTIKNTINPQWSGCPVGK